MKNLLLSLILLIITGCDRYEYVDKDIRFNKLSGNLEKLQYDGSWLSDKQEKKKNRANKVVDNGIPNNEWDNIIIDYLRFNDGWGCIVTNNSNYTIQYIEIEMRIEDKQTKEYLTTLELTCYTGLIKPYSIRNYISCSPDPPKLLDNQTWDYNIKKIQGFIELKLD